jgi:hypothetical protein
VVKWKPPEEGSLKINTDWAFMQDEGMGATGAMIRGSDNRLCMASARRINSTSLAFLAEAETLQDGVRLISTGRRNTSLWRWTLVSFW